MVVDWNEAHRHLGELRALLERGWSPDAEETARILDERARALARVPEAIDSEELRLTYLEFTVAGERLGVATEHVAEVAVAPIPTRIPGTPAFVSGMVNLRGQLLSVIDLAKFFGFVERDPGSPQRVIVLASNEMRFGINAAEIGGVRTTSINDLRYSASSPTGAFGQYLIGVTADPTSILDGAKLLSSREIVVGDDVNTLKPSSDRRDRSRGNEEKWQ